MSGTSHVLVSSAIGGTPRRLTHGDVSEVLPNWSSDGRSIYFGSTRGASWNVYRAPAAGGDAVRITRNGGVRSLESPDGRFLYFTKSQTAGIWRMGLGSESPMEELIGPNLPASLWANWAVTPQGICYVSVEAGSGAKGGKILLFDTKTRQIHQLGRVQGKVRNGGLSILPGTDTVLYSQLDEWGSDIFLLEHQLQ